MPQPSAVNDTRGAGIAAPYLHAAGTIPSSSGHLRVTVTPTGVTSGYVRAWLPAAQNAKQRNGDDRWSDKVQ